MTEVLMQYGLFLAKVVTVVLAFGAIVTILIAAARRERGEERLQIKHLNSKFDAMAQLLKKEVLPKKVFKEMQKAEKAHEKAKRKELKSAKGELGRRVFVINFHGDIKATAVSALREEVTAVLSVATPADEVVVRLENAGGLVHEHGLAASQLMRVKEKKIPLIIAVDKVAASGGYLMACVGDRILAAPFAVLGSIGVLAQLPNFHRLLNKHGIDFEQIKAGEYKRTLTVFGKNSDEGRAKLQEELEDTHALFKDFVAENRNDLDMTRVATGEHWYGKRALELHLVDELMTSDDYLLAASQSAELYEINYTAKKTVSEKLVSAVQLTMERLLFSWRRQVGEDRFLS